MITFQVSPAKCFWSIKHPFSIQFTCDRNEKLKVVLIYMRKSPDVVVGYREKEIVAPVYGVRLRNRWDTPCRVLWVRPERPQKMTDGEHVDASRWTKYKVHEGWHLNTRLPQNPVENKVHLTEPEHTSRHVCACFVGKVSSSQSTPLAGKLIKRDQSGPQKAIAIY